MIRIYRIVVLSFSVVTLSACGGGSGGSGIAEAGDVEVDIAEAPTGTITNTATPSGTGSIVPGRDSGSDEEGPDPEDRLPDGGIAGEPSEDTPAADDRLPGGGIAGDPLEDEPAIATPMFDGTLSAITSIYSDSQLAAIEALGLELNLGDDPPNIEGTFRLDPAILQSSSVPNDEENLGENFTPITFTFSNQDNSSLTLDLTTLSDSGDTQVDGSGAFISGSGNAFTVYFLAEVTFEGFTFTSSETYSGIITDAGITNLQQAIFILDDRGDPQDLVFDQDTGRLFIDTDGLSVRTEAGPGPLSDQEMTAADSGSDQESVPETEIEGSLTANFEPLIGGFILAADFFDGGFFSYSVEFTQDSVIEASNGGSILVASNDSGDITCTDQGGSSPTYICTVVNGLDQEVSVLFSLFGLEGFGNAFLCRPSVDFCDPSIVEDQLENSPNGNVQIFLIPVFGARSTGERELSDLRFTNAYQSMDK